MYNCKGEFEIYEATMVDEKTNFDNLQNSSFYLRCDGWRSIVGLKAIPVKNNIHVFQILHHSVVLGGPKPKTSETNLERERKILA